MSGIKAKTCEICEKKPATVLCSDCSKCYCGECSENAHREDLKNDHKTEAIPEGMNVKVTCPLHNGNPLEMFCINEVKLCCSACLNDNLHKDHKTAKIEEIAQDNEAFSAEERKKEFEDTLNRSATLDKKIAEAIEITKSEERRIKAEVEETFQEAHKKLKDEENRLLDDIEQETEKLNEKRNKAVGELGVESKASGEGAKINGEFERELEKLNEKKGKTMSDFETAHKKLKEEEGNCVGELVKASNEATDTLGNDLSALRELREHGRALIDAGKTSGKCSRLLELNIVSEMNVASKDFEKLFEAKMGIIKISWNKETRKLSFTRKLFNGVPSARDVAVKAVSWYEIGVSWEISDECDGVSYTVETRKEGENGWKEAKNGLADKKCAISGLEADSQYDVRVKCVKGASVSEWSGVAEGRTLKIPAPSNLKIDNVTYGTINLTWNKVEGASSYQIEADGSKTLSSTTTNSFVKEFSPSVEHSFRVRAVKGNSVGEWSGVVKGRSNKGKGMPGSNQLSRPRVPPHPL